MGIRMVRQPSETYNVKAGTNYYAEDDVNLTNSLGVLSTNTPGMAFNYIYGKIILDGVQYLVSAKDMEVTSDLMNFNSVTNIDDIIPFRYAYGNQDGCVIGKGNEISHTIDGSTFRVNSGRVVLQGVETDIDANGVSFTIDNASEIRYFVVYYEVNLATQTTSIKLSNYDTVGYPNIDLGDDLTANSSGIARLPLYRFTATSGVISNVTKVTKAIEYSGTALVGYDIDKGTVEERLTKLGFKEGTIEFDSSLTIETGDVVENYLHRQGNYVLGRLKTETITRDASTNIYLGRISKDFLPKQDEVFFANAVSSGNNAVYKYYLTIKEDGYLYVNLTTWSQGYYPALDIRIGYEAKPL